MMSPMSYQERNVVMTTTISWLTDVISYGWSLRYDKRMSNDGNDHIKSYYI